MGRVYDDISEEQEFWIGEQPMFFVATAAPDAHVNVSPRGLDTFRVLGPRRVAWLDLTGSGVETISHLRADGRITLMFCAFEGRPTIVRLSGRGTAVLPSADSFAALVAGFPPHPGIRSVIKVDVSRVADSCGYAVPRMSLEGERDVLDLHNAKKGPQKLAEYRVDRNAASIDGLPAWPLDEPAVR